MLNPNQLRAMIQLLDDDDHEVVEIVEQKFLEEGITAVDDLEQIWLDNEFPQFNVKIERILKIIQQQLLFQDVNDWIDSPEPSTLTGWILASRIQYPGLKLESLKNQLNQFKIDAWVMLSGVNNPGDQIAILNYIFYEKYGFKGNHENYHSPENSLLPRVLETKLGNPISLAILYMVIAQDLGMPVFGVNLPQHFVLAYCKMKTPPNHLGVFLNHQLLLSNVESVDFYFNPFSKGQIFNKESIDAFLKVIHVKKQENFYLPCSSIEIFKRILRNMHFAYSEQHDFEKQNDVSELMKLIGIHTDNDDSSDDKE